jgi:hypothetical protein
MEGFSLILSETECLLLARCSPLPLALRIRMYKSRLVKHLRHQHPYLSIHTSFMHWAPSSALVFDTVRVFIRRAFLLRRSLLCLQRAGSPSTVGNMSGLNQLPGQNTWTWPPLGHSRWRYLTVNGPLPPLSWIPLLHKIDWPVKTQLQQTCMQAEVIHSLAILRKRRCLPPSM